MIKFIIKSVLAIGLLILTISLHSCSALKGLEGCNKTLPVVVITKAGYSYTFNVPYCDTIRLGNDKVPDSVRISFKEVK